MLKIKNKLYNVNGKTNDTRGTLDVIIRMYSFIMFYYVIHCYFSRVDIILLK